MTRSDAKFPAKCGMLGLLFLTSLVLTAPVSGSIPAEESPPFGEPEAADREKILLDRVTSIACGAMQTSSQLGERGIYRVITREEIQAYGFASVEEALTLVPGIHVHAQSAAEKEASIRGLGHALSGGILVSVDGARVNLDQTGAADWGNLPVSIEDVERIEVFRGPHPVAGTSTASSGAVNIVTRTIDAPSRMSFAAGVGNHGLESGAAALGGRTAILPLSAGYQLNASWDRESPWRDGITGPSRRLRRLRGQMDLTVPRLGVALIDGWANGGRHETTFAPALGRLMSDTRDRHARVVLARRGSRLEYTRDWGHKNGTPLDLPWVFPVTTDYRRSIVSFQRQNEQTDRVLSRWGGVYEQSRVESFLLAGPWKEELWALFLDYQVVPRTAWTVSVNARYEQFQPLGGQISPRLAVSYQVDPRWRMWASTSRTHRNPSVAELTTSLTLPSGLGQTASEFPITTSGFDRLKRETISATELGTALALGSGSSLELVAHHYRTDDLISVTLERTYDSPPAPVPGLPAEYSYRNVGSTRTWGGEAELRLDLVSHWQGLASIAYLNARHSHDGSRVRDVPRWHLLGGVRCEPHSSLYLAFLGTYTSVRWPGGYRLAAYGVGNVHVGYRPDWAWGELSFAALNVLDRRHQETAHGDWIGRRFFLSWRTEY